MKKLKIFLLTLLMVITILPINTIAEGETLAPDNPDDSLFVDKNLGELIYFSSAATGSTGIISSNASLIPRREGEPEQLDLCVYPIDGFIKILHIDTTPDKTTLIVQGKNGDYNWSFSKTFTEKVEDKDNVTIKKSEIIEELKKIEELKNIKDIDLSKCKIWLEKGQGANIGAVLAETHYTTIDSVAIDIATPVVNEKPASSATHNITIDTKLSDVTWSPDVNNDKFGYYTKYKVSVTLSPVDFNSYVFAASPTATVNGEIANVERIFGSNSIKVTYTFPYTKDKLISAANPNSINVPNGTSLEDIVKLLPEQVSVETAGKSVSSLDVKWIVDQDIDYDPANKESQDITILGTVELPEDNSILPINNDGPAMVSVDINVSAFEIVPTPAPETGNGNSTGGNNTLIIPDTACK